MSAIGEVPSDREREVARVEAAEALEKYGEAAATILLMKAQMTHSAKRQKIYMLARRMALKGTA